MAAVLVVVAWKEREQALYSCFPIPRKDRRWAPGSTGEPFLHSLVDSLLESFG